VLLEHGCSPVVVRGLVKMLPAIELHDEALAEANEIHDVLVQRMLSSKFEGLKRVVAEQAPEVAFGVRGVLSERARTVAAQL
jgi:hypothetical protein